MPIHPLTATPRTAIMVLFAAFGAAVGTLAGSVPSIMRNAAIDSQTMGLGLTISTLMTVGALTISGRLARHVTGRSALLVVLPVFAVLLFAYLTAQSPLWFYLAIIPMGLAFGVTDLFMNAEATAIEHDMRRPVFTAFHACVSAGVAVMAVVASFISTRVGTWATGLLGAAGFGIAWVYVFAAVAPRELPGSGRAKAAPLPGKLPLAILGTAAGLIIAAETTALLWSATLLDGLAPALAAIAGLGAAFFGLCNAAIRFPGDALRARFGNLPLMAVSLVIAIVGFAGLGLTSSFAWSVAFFALVGAGTALQIPCIFAMAAGFVPENRPGALGFVSLLSVLPRSLAPWAFGIVAAAYGSGAAFGLVAVALGVALMLLGVLGRLGERQ